SHQLHGGATLHVHPPSRFCSCVIPMSQPSQSRPLRVSTLGGILSCGPTAPPHRARPGARFRWFASTAPPPPATAVSRRSTPSPQASRFPLATACPTGRLSRPCVWL